jgi:hypothetical protein
VWLFLDELQSIVLIKGVRKTHLLLFIKKISNINNAEKKNRLNLKSWMIICRPWALPVVYQTVLIFGSTGKIHIENTTAIPIPYSHFYTHTHTHTHRERERERETKNQTNTKSGSSSSSSSSTTTSSSSRSSFFIIHNIILTNTFSSWYHIEPCIPSSTWARFHRYPSLPYIP